jgi:hypothetical protein
MWLVSLILLSSTKSKKCEKHETLTLVPSMSVIVVRGLMNLMEIVVDAVAEISEVEAVVEVAVEDAADSTTMEATEIVIQDGVTEVVVRVVVVRVVSVFHLSFFCLFTDLMKIEFSSTRFSLPTTPSLPINHTSRLSLSNT